MVILEYGIDASHIYEEPVGGGNGVPTRKHCGLDHDAERST
jgi:hypothetical protein